MNERIQELALAAGKYADETQPRGSYTRNGMWLYAYNEKFAELIVEQCMKVAVFKDDGTVATAQVAGYMAAGRSTAAQMIREHFGVE